MRIVHQRNTHHDLRRHTCYNCSSEIEVDHKVDSIRWVKYSYISYFDPDPGHGRDEDRVKYQVSEERAMVTCPNCSADMRVDSRNETRRRIGRAGHAG